MHTSYEKILYVLRKPSGKVNSRQQLLPMDRDKSEIGTVRNNLASSRHGATNSINVSQSVPS